MNLIGRHIHTLASCSSTNSEMKERAKQGQLSHGEVLLTYNQKAGRGQRGKTWLSQPHQSITFSVFLKTHFLKIEYQFYLNIIVSLSIFKAIKAIIPQNLKHHLRIKWPNDLYFNHQKIGGILIEGVLRQKYLDYSIVGIGLNINERTCPFSAISLFQIIGKESNTSEIIQHLLEIMNEYFRRLKNEEYNTLHELYLHHLYAYKTYHYFQYTQKETRFVGKIIGITKQGRLLIQTEIGIKNLYQWGGSIFNSLVIHSE